MNDLDVKRRAADCIACMLVKWEDPEIKTACTYLVQIMAETLLIEEREACAQIAEQTREEYAASPRQMALRIAARIRSRANKTPARIAPAGP